MEGEGGKKGGEGWEIGRASCWRCLQWVAEFLKYSVCLNKSSLPIDPGQHGVYRLEACEIMRYKCCGAR